jgi:hypothetical protein
MHERISKLVHTVSTFCSLIPHILELVLLCCTPSAVAILPQSPHQHRRFISLPKVRTHDLHPKIKPLNSERVNFNSSCANHLVVKLIRENSQKSCAAQYNGSTLFQSGTLEPAKSALLPYKSSAESSSWRAIPSIHTYCRQALLKTYTNMHLTILAAIASAAVVAGTPVVCRPTAFWVNNADNCDKQLRREAIDPTKFPHCPSDILALLPDCIDSPSEACFANAPQFPQECLEEIKKVYPALPGLPAATVDSAPQVQAAPPVR